MIKYLLGYKHLPAIDKLIDRIIKQEIDVDYSMPGSITFRIEGTSIRLNYGKYPSVFHFRPSILASIRLNRYIKSRELRRATEVIEKLMDSGAKK